MRHHTGAAVELRDGIMALRSGYQWSAGCLYLGWRPYGLLICRLMVEMTPQSQENKHGSATHCQLFMVCRVFYRVSTDMIWSSRHYWALW